MFASIHDTDAPPKFSLGVFPYDTEVRSGYENFEEAYFDIFTTLKVKKKVSYSS